MVANRAALKVLHLLAPAEFGGLERVVQTLCEGLSENGHSVLVCPIASGDDPIEPFIQPLAAAGVPVTPVRVPHRRYVQERKEVGDRISEFAPDIVHTHGTRVDVIDSGVARKLGVPTVTTVHGFTGNGLKNRLYEALQRWWFRRFDAVVAVSRPLADELRGAGLPNRILTTIPNARPAQTTLLEHENARKLLGVPNETFHIGWVGRLTPEKGADVLVDALGEFDGEVSCTVSIVGEGPQRASLEERTRSLGPGCRVRWHGKVPDAGRLFRAFDLFVLSSRTEGTPIVLFEAMQAETPVVATRVGGVPDVVSDHEALLVPPEAPGALARAIRQVVRHPEAARTRAHRASRILDERYDQGRWIQRYEELYRSLLPEKAGTISSRVCP